MNTTPAFFIFSNGQQHGPYTESELQGRYSTRMVTQETLIWREGLSGWTRVGDYYGMSAGPQAAATAAPRLGAAVPVVAGPISFAGAKFPKWPMILTIACAVLWFLFIHKASSIDRESVPYIAEYNRMHSTRYTIEVATESFFRGAMGDPFGKAREVTQRDEEVRNTLLRMSADYKAAQGNAGFFLFLTVVFGITWGVKRIRFNKRLKN